MQLNDPITSLKGVGPALAKSYQVLGIETLNDLVEHLPRRYEDYSQVQKTSQLTPGPVTIKAIIKQVKGRYVRRGMHIIEAVASDDSGSVRLIWFNQPYRANQLKSETEYFISGEFALGRQRLSIMNPSVETVSSMPLNTARIIPIYQQTKGLTSRQIRHAMHQVRQLIVSLPETLPQFVLKDNRLPARSEAYMNLHFPQTSNDIELGRKRVGFEEVLELNLAGLLNKADLARSSGLKINFKEPLARKFVDNLPFKLTDDQRKVAWQIYLDMQKSQPMNRLVEGDVGSGKTVVAAMAGLMVMSQGFQVALMAPTEILARQHAESLSELFKPLGFGNSVGLLVGSLTSTQKKTIQQKINDRQIQFIVGTHALIQDGLELDRLGLVIIDEQHRFGVSQRQALQAKSGYMPHVLLLTATPIPRSLALTLYGELDVSIIASKPPGRQSTITKICSPNSKAAVYQEIDQQIESGRQAFFVTPLIKESDVIKFKSAEKLYDELRTGPFKHRRLGLLHGQLKPADKDKIMQDFVDHKLDIIVATTVIEVGVNVPNASVMMIEGADRFGLAQIHQLRGRVGRSQHQGYCYLMMSDSSEPGPRLRALEQLDDGFRLAELDLRLRGPGAIYGTVQHGQLDLRVAQLSDVKLIASARASAQAIIDREENLVQYPQLSRRVEGLRAVTNLN